MHQYGVDDSRNDECDNHDHDQKQEFVHFVEHMGRNADPGEEFLIPNRMVNAKSFVFINGWKIEVCRVWIRHFESYLNYYAIIIPNEDRSVPYVIGVFGAV